MPAINPDNLKQTRMGLAQFLAVRDEVLALLAKGYTRRALYNELYEKGVFTRSYRRFCEYMSRVPMLGQPHAPYRTAVMPQKSVFPAAAPLTVTVQPKPEPQPQPATSQPPSSECSPAPAVAAQAAAVPADQGDFKHFTATLNELL